jgi:hypothetical protein
MRWTPKHCRNQVQNTLDALMATRLAVDVQVPVARNSVGGFTRVTWPANPEVDNGRRFFEDFYALETYFGWLMARQYSVVLLDGALLQITFDFRSDRFAGHRLAYIPCPFDIGDDGAERLRIEPILDVIDGYRDRGEEYLRLRSPIRFDYDPTAASLEHPASHITLNHQDCRIPACAPLTLAQFIEFIFRRFYPSVWAEHDFLADADQHPWRREIVGEHEQSLHLNWRADPTRIGAS